MENERFERGLAALRKANKKGLDDLVRSMDAVAPDLARFVIEFAYGDIYIRPGLLPDQRELCIVAALTALGNRERQLRDHIQAALNSGCTPQEVTEVILMMAVYAGFPAAINGMEVMRELLPPKPSSD
ncbi:MAG: carboxymuconolactone decarboxylase family protein [Euryarchaeota archaeon]|nr:carboxymuconolactone decarboxylase family protein [Euryarchaeota archaeon]